MLLRSTRTRGLSNSVCVGRRMAPDTTLKSPSVLKALRLLWAHSRSRYWFNERSTDVFFPKFQPIAPIFAEGLITTLELSLRGNPNPKPIDMWWLLDYPEVKMINLVSPTRVTLLVATPWPPNVSPREIWGEDAEAYVTGRLGIEWQFRVGAGHNRPIFLLRSLPQGHRTPLNADSTH